MNLLRFEPKPDARLAEAELVEKLKTEIYRFSGVISIAQVIGCLRIVEGEIIEEAK